MEWNTCLKQAIDYMEEHLLDAISTENMVEEIGKKVHMSPFYFQKCFQMVTGFSVGEYLRNRRLYEAACELASYNIRVIDVALKYGYDTPESFSKAFRRFHGITPTMARKRENPIKQFLPLQIKISVRGGKQIDFSYEKMKAFTLIGFEEVFSFPSSYEKIPKFWMEISEKYCKNLKAGNEPANEYEQAIVDNRIGEYGAVIHNIGKGNFRYLLAGLYQGGNVPEGMVLHTFESCNWVKFETSGANPDAIQRLNTQVYQEWMPRNREFERTGYYNIEWYGSADGKSSIWIPATKKQEDC